MRVHILSRRQNGFVLLRKKTDLLSRVCNRRYYVLRGLSPVYNVLIM